LASLCSPIGRDLFAVPIFCKDIVFVLLEPPDSGIDWNLNRGKRGIYQTFFYKSSIGFARRSFFFELPAVLDALLSLD